MRRDTIIGLAVAALTHYGFFQIGERSPRNPAPTHSPEQTTVRIVMPELKPDDPDPIIEDSLSKTTVSELAPPMQPDVPSMDPGKFTQPVEPPPIGGIDPRAVKLGPIFGPPKLKPFDIRSLDRTPEATFQPQPNYPYGLSKEGVIGWAIVRFVVDSHGNVADAVVRESSQHDFDESCLQAVRRWKFKPGTKSGRAVSFWAEQYFRFTLNGAE